MNRPDFFIVGAPKCGTTSLHEYLRAHPSVFTPRLKEPHYFARDLRIGGSHRAVDWYLSLFAGAGVNHRRLGESSVYYLYSHVAIESIYEFAPGSRLIVMLRNPVDLVYSLHGQLLYTGHESEPDFETAWRLQWTRQVHIPTLLPEPKLVQYSDVGMLGRQASQLLEIFPRSQVKFILFNEFARQPASVYADVLGFLDLPHDGRTEFPHRNPGLQSRRFWPLKKGLRSRKLLKKVILKYAGKQQGDNVVRAMTHAIRKPRTPLREELRVELDDHFAEDVKELKRIIGKNVPW